MAVQGVHPPAVINYYRIPGVVQELGEHDAATLSSVNWRTGGSGKIDSGVRRIRMAVQDAALAEITSGFYAIERRAKSSGPEFFRRYRGKDFAELLAVFLSFCELLGIRLDEVGRYRQLLGCELPCPHADGRGACYRFAGLRLSRNAQLVFPGGQLQVEPEERAPPIRSLRGGGIGLPERNVFIRPCASDSAQRLGAAHFGQYQASLAR